MVMEKFLRLCIYMLTCGHKEITEIVHLYVCTCLLVPYISGNSKAVRVGTLPMFRIEKPFCACTPQRNLRIAWRLQNRILVSVKIKLQAITSGNDNSFPRSLEGAGTSQLYHSLYSVWDCAALVQYITHTL